MTSKIDFGLHIEKDLVISVVMADLILIKDGVSECFINKKQFYEELS